MVLRPITNHSQTIRTHKPLGPRGWGWDLVMSCQSHCCATQRDCNGLRWNKYFSGGLTVYFGPIIVPYMLFSSLGLAIKFRRSNANNNKNVIIANKRPRRFMSKKRPRRFEVWKVADLLQVLLWGHRAPSLQIWFLVEWTGGCVLFHTPRKERKRTGSWIVIGPMEWVHFWREISCGKKDSVNDEGTGLGN